MSKFQIEAKWALIFTIAALLWMLLEKSLGWHDEHISKHAIYTNLFAVVAIAIYAIALVDKKKNFYNGTMSWTQGFISGTVLSVIIAILSPLAQYITQDIITPSYFDNAIAYATENNRMTKDAAETYFNLKSYILQSIFGALAMGVVTSAIVALFVRSKQS